MTTHAEYAAGLREFADWIELHPEVDLPSKDITNYATDTREYAGIALAALKPCKKRYSDSMFYLDKSFGPITYTLAFFRNAVCTPKVIGKKIVEEQYIPPQTFPSKLIPAHEEDIIEWDCHEALLAPVQEISSPAKGEAPAE